MTPNSAQTIPSPSQATDTHCGSLGSGLLRRVPVALLGLAVIAAVASPIFWPIAASSTRSARAIHCRSAGVIDHVAVSFGSIVKAGDVIARLDCSELDHQIESTNCRIALIADEIEMCFHAAARGDFSRASSRGQLLLRRKSLECDLKHFTARKQSLEVRAPVAGKIVTQDPGFLVGQLATAGGEIMQIEPGTGD